MKKKIWRVYAKESVVFSIDIKAETAIEAEDIAYRTDSSQWAEVSNSSSWDVGLDDFWCTEEVGGSYSGEISEQEDNFLMSHFGSYCDEGWNVYVSRLKDTVLKYMLVNPKAKSMYTGSYPLVDGFVSFDTCEPQAWYQVMQENGNKAPDDVHYLQRIADDGNFQL